MPSNFVMACLVVLYFYIVFIVLGVCKRYRRQRYSARHIKRADVISYMEDGLSPISENPADKITKAIYVDELVTKRHKDSFVRIDTDGAPTQSDDCRADMGCVIADQRPE